MQTGTLEFHQLPGMMAIFSVAVKRAITKLEVRSYPVSFWFSPPPPRHIPPSLAHTYIHTHTNLRGLAQVLNDADGRTQWLLVSASGSFRLKLEEEQDLLPNASAPVRVPRRLCYPWSMK